MLPTAVPSALPTPVPTIALFVHVITIRTSLRFDGITKEDWTGLETGQFSEAFARFVHHIDTSDLVDFQVETIDTNVTEYANGYVSPTWAKGDKLDKAAQVSFIISIVLEDLGQYEGIMDDYFEDTTELLTEAVRNRTQLATELGIVAQQDWDNARVKSIFLRPSNVTLSDERFTPAKVYCVQRVSMTPSPTPVPTPVPSPMPTISPLPTPVSVGAKTAARHEPPLTQFLSTGSDDDADASADLAAVAVANAPAHERTDPGTDGLSFAGAHPGANWHPDRGAYARTEYDSDTSSDAGADNDPDAGTEYVCRLPSSLPPVAHLFLPSAMLPSPVPTGIPTMIPTPVPTSVPTSVPTPVPSPVPTPVPTGIPTPVPTPVPSPVPSPVPTGIPTPVPTPVPSPVPTPVPTGIPTPVPSPVPTGIPTPVSRALCMSQPTPRCQSIWTAAIRSIGNFSFFYCSGPSCADCVEIHSRSFGRAQPGQFAKCWCGGGRRVPKYPSPSRSSAVCVGSVVRNAEAGVSTTAPLFPAARYTNRNSPLPSPTP